MRRSRFYDWYEQGLLVPAIAGVDGCFVSRPANDFEHHFIYALNQLSAWAAEHSKEDEATHAFKDAATTLLERDEPEACLRLVWAYIIVHDHRDFAFSVPLDELEGWAKAARERGAGGAEDEESLWFMVRSALRELRA